MGDIAEMTLNGDMCEGCGEWLGEGDGYPRLCPGCARERRQSDGPLPHKSRGSATCPDCGRSMKGKAAVMQHQNAKHGRAWTIAEIASARNSEKADG